MIGVYVNVLAVLFGGTLGLFLNKGLPENVKKVVMQAIGLSTIAIGVIGTIETEEILLLVISLVVGGLVGAIIRIDDRLDDFGLKVEKKFGSEGKFAKGFVMASIIYTLGSMTILGSLEAGLNQNYTLLFTKSILDGVTAIIFTSTLGYGVIFSIIPIFVIQGGLVLVSKWVGPYISDEAIREMGAVGSVLIIGIGITLLEIKKIRLGDLLPSIIVPLLFYLALNVIEYL